MSTPNEDWRKQATVVDNDMLERSFMDQAHSFVANKARPLMRAPYKIGFEIVKKNDTNTRMVGVFGFRVDDDLYYVPCFFINGEIKGTDLLYRHSSKTFVPLTEDWCKFIIQKSQNSQGEGVRREQLRHTTPDVNMRDMMTPPHTAKSASVFEDMEKVSHDYNISLKDFILEDGGFSTVEMITDKLTRDNKKFANALLNSVAKEDFMPEELIAYEVKEASEEKDILTLHLNTFNNGVKIASEEFYKKGFWFDDKRDSKDLSVVYESSDCSMVCAKSIGIYNYTFDNGNTEKILVVPASSLESNRTCVVGLEGSNKGRSTITYKDVMAKPCVDNIDTLKTVPTKPGDYLVVDTGTGRDHNIKITKIKVTPSGVDLSVNQYGYRHITVRYNPKTKKGFDMDDGRLIGGNCILIPCENEKESLALGDPEDISSFLYGDTNYKKASLHADGPEDFYLLYDGYKSASVSAVGMMAHLAADLDIGAEVAENLVKQASDKNNYSFVLQGENLKSATALRFLQESRFEDPELDSDFGILTDKPQIIRLKADHTPLQVPKPRLGDIWEPGMGKGSLLTASPESLYAMSKDKNIPNLFEHGVIGELVKTYDSSSLVDKYMPKLEEGLDCLGRLLFLVYWKPEDFIASYGGDDIQSLEHEILANFKSFGELILNLLKKETDRVQDTNSLSA